MTAYTYTVSAYNTRRYGRPWIARVASWQAGSYPELKFGVSVSDQIAEVLAMPGDLLKLGQKDNRDTRKSVNVFAVALAKGYETVSDKEALTLRDVTPDQRIEFAEALRAERVCLAEIAEIERKSRRLAYEAESEMEVKAGNTRRAGVVRELDGATLNSNGEWIAKGA